MMKKLLPILFLSLLSISIIANGIVISTKSKPSVSDAPMLTTKVFIEPQNGTANVGEQFDITVKIANVTGLYAFSLEIRWGTAVLKYITHSVPVGNSTLGGVLNAPVVLYKDVVDETASIANSAIGTTYWIAYSSFGGAPSYNGTGIVFTMTFEVLRDGECDIYFTKVALSDKFFSPIPFVQEDGYFYRAGLNQVPVADFTFSPDPAVANKTTTFDASDSYDPDPGEDVALYIWNFKDGTATINTTSPIITHTFTITTTIPVEGLLFNVELTVLDDQGEGSQSKPTQRPVTVVHPRPVAEFTVWPEDNIAVLNKSVTFNASDSYDPDPGGNITEYRWNFGDGNLTTTINPIITHTFQAIKDYIVGLIVVDDSDGLPSNSEVQTIVVVQRRDIEVSSVTVSPSHVTKGEEATIDVTIANKGEAAESFNITAYYNSTMTDWMKIDEMSVSDFPGQYAPRLEFVYGTSLNNTVNHILTKWVSGQAPLVSDTKVRIATSTGFWTINPGLQNTAATSPSLVTGTPLTTGGWIREERNVGAKKLNGELAAGDLAFRVRLYATETGVSVTVWTRVLKSDNPDTQAPGSLVTVVKDWTALFTDTALSTTAQIFNGNISIPATTFTDEYLFFEFQLEVTANSAGSATTDVVFQIGGSTGDAKSQIFTTTFSYRNMYAFSWNTEFVSGGNHVVMVNTTQVPHETNVTNNIAYSNAIQVAELVVEVPPLEVSLDVGTIHFRGEIAEFYLLVTSSGKRVDALLNAFMFFRQTVTEIGSTDIDHIDTGVYMISYQIPIDASTGTYALVVDASRLIPELNFTQTGSTLKSFLVSPTFTYWDTWFIGWNATLAEIKGDTAIIITAIGEIKTNLDTVNATLSSLIVGSKDEILAKIDTALGPVITSLDTINATITSVQGDMVTIDSNVGDARTAIDALQSTLTLGLVAASVLSALAAIVAILIFLHVRRLSK